jgi:DNA-binding MarR family transcriptional regulator
MTTSTAGSCGVASRARFDESIHAPTRLRLCALLRPVDHIDFSVLATTLGLSDANLSKTVRALTELGYMSTTKEASTTRRDARRTTRIALTPAGRDAIDGHLAALQDLASAKDLSATATDR